jgi:signal transduction histidine kinase
MLSNIARAARRLDDLTRDVMNYTKVATAKIDLTVVDPADVLQDVLTMNPGLQPPNAVIAVVRPMFPVLANRTLLSQCLSNLLGNAVKFVKPGTTPHVVVGTEKRNTQESAGTVTTAAEGHARAYVRLFVQDDGIGIDPATQSKLFGIFERGRGVGHVPGTGIGLAIVAKAAQRMNGRHGVESTLGEGSRFWIELGAP